MSPKGGLPFWALFLLGPCLVFVAGALAAAGDTAYNERPFEGTALSGSVDQGPISPPVEVTRNTKDEDGKQGTSVSEHLAFHGTGEGAKDLRHAATKAMNSLSTSNGDWIRADASSPLNNNEEDNAETEKTVTGMPPMVGKVGTAAVTPTADAVKKSQDDILNGEPVRMDKGVEKGFGSSETAVASTTLHESNGKVAAVMDVNAAEGGSVPSPGTEGAREKLYRSLLEGYSKLERPVNASDPEITQVSVSMKFNKMWDLSQRDMTYYANVRLILTWNDPNLAFAVSDAGGSHRIMANEGEIWTPPYFFKNSENRKEVIDETSISFDGTVTYMARLTIKFFTSLELAAFPFDTQHLTLMLGTFGRMEDNVRFSVNDFTFNDLTCKSSLWEFKSIAGGVSDENKQVNVQIVIRRKIGNFFFKSFLPMVVIVLSSSGSFWIDPVSAVPARVAVCVTTMLTTISFYYTVTKDLPRISLPTWMDIWVDMSLFFVFMTLFEFIIVHMYRRMLTQRETHLEQGTKPSEDEEAQLLTARATEIKLKRARLENSTGIWIDRFSRIWHPVGYSLLNFVMLSLALLAYFFGGNIRYPW